MELKNKLTAQQLRIGNLVEYEGEIYEIDTISKLFPTLNTVAFGIGVVGWDNLNPIPLTEEWLLKFGFEVENFDYNIKISECGVVSLQLIAQDEKCSSFSVCVIQSDEDELDDYVFLSDIKYVHSLQNLFYSLTNEELAINEILPTNQTP